MNVNEKIYDAIVIGAGVVGPCIATSLSRQGRKVLLVERDWSKPNRIVGELLQPKGIALLKDIGMIQALNNINAIDVLGYHIKYFDQSIDIDYPSKVDSYTAKLSDPILDCLKDGNDKLLSDSTIDAAEWEKDEKIRGLTFHHGDFIINLRSIAKSEQNIECIEGSVLKLLHDKNDTKKIIGVEVNIKDDTVFFYSKIVISCDGINSNFRKHLIIKNKPKILSFFIGVLLENCELNPKKKGHVICGDHDPILIYQISPVSMRILCSYKSNTMPSKENSDLLSYLHNVVSKKIPKEMASAFKKKIKKNDFKIMPNQYLRAVDQSSLEHKGLIFLGDSLNMRHPLTGGGMTAGLNDVVILAKLLHPKNIEDFSDHNAITNCLKKLHSERKGVNVTINTLSVSLYSLFSSSNRSLKILQKGCFEYFKLGDSCMSDPIGLLSGVFPYPSLLFCHFFSVAFYSIYFNFIEKGFRKLHISVYEAFLVFITALNVFTPYFFKELFL